MLIGVVVDVMDSEARAQRGIADEETAETQRLLMLERIESLAVDMHLLKETLNLNTKKRLVVCLENHFLRNQLNY